MTEQSNPASPEQFHQILTPQLSRRRFLIAGTSAAILTAITAAESAAAPLRRPKDPSSLPPDITDNFSFLGDIDINHKFDTNTGGLAWNIDQDLLNTAIRALAPIAQKQKSVAGIRWYIDQSRSLFIPFGISVIRDGTTMLHFPIATSEFNLDGNTKPMNPSETAILKKIEASWDQGLQKDASAYDSNGTPLPFIQDFRP